MGARDHSCDGCGAGGFNNDLECSCNAILTSEDFREAAGQVTDPDLRDRLLSAAAQDLVTVPVEALIQVIAGYIKPVNGCNPTMSETARGLERLTDVVDRAAGHWPEVPASGRNR